MENNWRNEMDGHISKVFNRFAGQTVNPADPQDKVLAEMRQEAAMYYSYLRLVPPGTARSADDSKITRINAELESTGDGKWRIGNRFFRG